MNKTDLAYSAGFRRKMGLRVRQLRESRNMSQSALAKQLRIRPSFLQMIESGSREATTYICLLLHRIFDVSLQYIITGKETGEKYAK
ncbi:MAG: helix-turn-helix transcriptional regulator [Defluviitaleaceae bacterium]|nr:helix-turn-helix transcriptional regulator [Defluviitaleaceae bacterium]